MVRVMSKLKLVFVRFLIVCWIMTTVGVIWSFFWGLFNLDIDIIGASLGSGVFFYTLISITSFIFLGIIHPKKLIQLIKAP